MEAFFLERELERAERAALERAFGAHQDRERLLELGRQALAFFHTVDRAKIAGKFPSYKETHEQLARLAKAFAACADARQDLLDALGALNADASFETRRTLRVGPRDWAGRGESIDENTQIARLREAAKLIAERSANYKAASAATRRQRDPAAWQMLEDLANAYGQDLSAERPDPTFTKLLGTVLELAGSGINMHDTLKKIRERRAKHALGNTAPIALIHD